MIKFAACLLSGEEGLKFKSHQKHKNFYKLNHFSRCSALLVDVGVNQKQFFKISCELPIYSSNLTILSMARAINTTMVTILLGVLYSADPNEMLSVLPENPNLYFPTKFFSLTCTIRKL